MKVAAIAAFFLLLASSAIAACPVGVAGPRLLYQRSSRHISLTVLSGGQPAKDVLVEVTPTGKAKAGQAPLVLASGEDGRVSLPDLSAGKYVIGALAADRGRAQLLLHVTRNRKDKTNFEMALEVPAQYTEWRSGNLPAGALAEACDRDSCLSHLDLQIQKFAGVATDPTGSVIPATEITILRNGPGNKRVIKIESDQHGRFSAELEAGTYVAYFRASAFRTEIVPFGVAAQGAEEVRIKMLVGAGC
jgi:hypothetical protein